MAIDMKKLHAAKARWKRHYLAQRARRPANFRFSDDILSVEWNIDHEHLSKIERFRLRALVIAQEKK